MMGLSSHYYLYSTVVYNNILTSGDNDRQGVFSQAPRLYIETRSTRRERKKKKGNIGKQTVLHYELPRHDKKKGGTVSPPPIKGSGPLDESMPIL